MAVCLPVRAAASAAVLLALALGAGAQAPEKLAALLPVVKEADGLASQADARIWSGFHFKEVPLVFFDGATRQALVAHFQPLPEGFSPADPALPGTGYGSLPAGTLAVQGSQPLGGRLAAWVDASAAAGALTVRTLYREAFRVRLQYMGVPPPPPLPAAGYPSEDPENAALLRAEAALAGRLAAAPRDQAAGLAATLAALRTRRQARLAPEVAAWENGREVNDGLAEYAASAATGDRTPVAIGADAGAVRAADPRHWASTGGAVALAADAAAPGWKVSFEKSARTDLSAELRRLADAAPADLAALNLDALVTEEKKAAEALAARRAELLTSIQQAKGIVVVLQLEGWLDPAKGISWTNRFDPKGVVPVDVDRKIHSYYKLVGAGVLEFTSSRPSLITVRRQITTGFSPEDLALYQLTVDGNPTSLSVESPSATGRVEVRAPQFELKVNYGRVEFDASSRHLVVTPLASPGAS